MRSRLEVLGASVAPVALAMGIFTAEPAFSQNSEFINTETEEKVSVDADIIDRSVSWDNPKLPWVALGGMAGLTALFGLYGAYRRPKLFIPVTLACGAAVVLLANPEYETKNYERKDGEIIVVLDETASQNIGDRAAITQEVQQIIAEQLQGFENTAIRFVSLNDENINGTRLFEALDGQDGIKTENLSGVVLVTDGQVDDVPEFSPYGVDVPFYTLLTGRSGEMDRVATLLNAPQFGLVDELQTIRFRIDDNAVPVGHSIGPVEVQVSSEGQVLETMSVVPGEVAEVEVSIQKPGVNYFSIQAPELEGELTQSNNTLVVNMNGIREELNVLVLSGEVHAGMRPLRDFYMSDPDSNLIHFTPMMLRHQSSKSKRGDLSLVRTPIAEVFGDALFKYDLMVLDRFEDHRILPARFLSAMATHAENNGGSMLVIAGPEYAGRRTIADTRVGEVMPVTPTGEVTEGLIVPELSDTGERHPITRGVGGTIEPDWGPWTRYVDTDVTEGGQVLLETEDGDPLLVIAEKGEARVAILNSDKFYQWGRGFKGGGPDARLLLRVSHWLMKNPDLEAEALRVIPNNDNTITIQRQSLSDETPKPVQLTYPDGSVRTLEFTEERIPGLWEITQEYNENGVYQVSQDDDYGFTAFTKVGGDLSNEMDHVVSTAEHLQPIADQTGGAIVRVQNEQGDVIVPDLRQLPADYNETGKANYGEGWLGFVENDAKELKSIERTPLIPGWVGALFMAASLAWGWSHDQNHRKVAELRNGLRSRRKDIGSHNDDRPSLGV